MFLELLKVRSGNSHSDAKGDDSEIVEPLSPSDREIQSTTDIEEKSNNWTELDEEKDTEGNLETLPLTVEDVLLKLRRIWNQKQFIHPPVQGSNQSSAINSPSDGAISSKALFNQILQQLQHPAQWAGGKLWLDQDFALSLRGLAVLAQHPQLLQTLGKSVPIPTRAVRIIFTVLYFPD